MSYPTHSNHLGSHYQTIPLFDVRHGPGWKGERVGNQGLFGIFQQPTYASDSTWVDSRGVIVQIVQHWGCQPGDGWLPVRNFRDAHISSRVEGFITGSGHVYTGITFPVHHLCEEEKSWVVEVDCKALFIPALTETPVGILVVLVLCGMMLWKGTQHHWMVPLMVLLFGVLQARSFLRDLCGRWSAAFASVIWVEMPQGAWTCRLSTTSSTQWMERDSLWTSCLCTSYTFRLCGFTAIKS